MGSGEQVLNIGATLREAAMRWPDERAVVVPSGWDAAGKVVYDQRTFSKLDWESDNLAFGLQRMGVVAGTRMVLMVRPSVEFIALTFALFKVGAVVVLIDPGMGPRRVFRCLDQVEPEGFVAVPIVQALRGLSLGRFPKAQFNVTVGKKWFWGGSTYRELVLEAGGDSSATNRGAHAPRSPFSITETKSTDPAAIIFTSGSTGPAKGVVYEHGMFAAQVEWLRDFYHIQPGELDLPGLPFFALFNVAMGVTTVVPEMDPTRPARVDPAKIVEAIHNQKITEGFGSPAIWKRVGEFCEQHEITFPTIRRIFSAGAPVPPDVLARMKKTLVGDGAEMFTPYGATEALPVASISASEVLQETAKMTREGAGTCVGSPHPKIRLRIIEITDAPIGDLSKVQKLPAGQIGEIIVRGDVVTREYFQQPDATTRAKIRDGDGFWHRMGDVGYLDERGRLWFCGRKAHVVETERGRLFTDQVEPIFNTHPRVFRTALVGVGEKPRQSPVLVIEPEPFYQPSIAEIRHVLIPELREIGKAYDHTRGIERMLVYPEPLPVDVRHNTKINREKLAAWAGRK